MRLTTKLIKFQDALNKAFARKFKQVDEDRKISDDRLDKLEKINEDNDRR